MTLIFGNCEIKVNSKDVAGFVYGKEFMVGYSHSNCIYHNTIQDIDYNCGSYVHEI